MERTDTENQALSLMQKTDFRFEDSVQSYETECYNSGNN